MSTKEKIILPEKYYLDYFNYVLSFVEKHYDHVLDEPEYMFYQAFRDLSEEAQCLYLRFSNRRGDFFRINKISYPEIPDVLGAKEELVHQEFIRINESLDMAQFGLFTKSELTRLFDFLEPKQRKEELLLSLTEEDLDLIHEEEEIAEVLKNAEVDFLKLLFFGNRYGQMTDFVIRDVGNIKLEQLDESKFKPWFQNREEALAVMHISQLKRMIREIVEADLPLEEYLEEMPWDRWLLFPRSKKYAERLLIDLGAHFERKQQPELALTYYQHTDKSPSRERQIRILEKRGDTNMAVEIARKIIEKPANASENTFASDYLNRTGIRINRSMTERIKNAPSITIERDYEYTVEHCSLLHFQEQGWDGIHTENFLWRGLFGLIFWNEIFDEQYGSFHHPLQRQPSDLNDEQFFESREVILKEKLDSLKSRKGLLKHIREIHDEKNGMANRFVTWHESLLPTSEVMISKLPFAGLKKVMLEMARNMKENSTGFPDLFLWNNDDYQFYEIKSVNDQLSAQQLFWLNYFDSVRIKSEVLRVYYSN